MLDTVIGGETAVNIQPEKAWDAGIESYDPKGEAPVEPKQEEKPAEEPTESELDEDDDEPEEGGPPRKKKSGYYRGKIRAEEKLKLANQRLQELEAELAKTRIPQPEPVSEELQEPAVDNFDSFAEYLTALRKYDREVTKNEAAKLLEQREAKLKEEQTKTSFAQRVVEQGEAFDAALAARESEHPGITKKFEAIVEEGLISFPLAVMLAQSPAQVDIAEHLIENRAELEALNQMTPQQAQLSLARLEGRLEGKKSQPTRQTKASPPINPNRSGSGGSQKAPHEMSLSELDKKWKPLTR